MLHLYNILIVLSIDVDDEAQRAQQGDLNTAAKSETALSDAATQSDPDVPDDVLLRALDEVDRTATDSACGASDSQLANAAADAERDESSGAAGRVVASTERAPGHATASNSNGASASEPPSKGDADGDAIMQEVARTTANKLQAFAFHAPSETPATHELPDTADRPLYSRQEGIDEGSQMPQATDILACQTIQAGGGIKRVHARLILGNNKPPQLLIEPARASGRRFNGQPGPAKRTRTSKRSPDDQPC